MTRLSKNQAKIAFSFCTLFSLYFPVAFSQQVDTAWVRRYNGPGNGDDKAVALAVDSSGNVYVTGSSCDSTTGYDYCTIKYLPNGDTGWVRRYDGPASRDDVPTALGLDNEGNVVVTGRSVIVDNQITTYNEGFATIKYDPQGNLLWVRAAYMATQYSTGGAYALAVNGQGSIYVTGELFDLFFLLWVTIKYDPNGNASWSAIENNLNPSLSYGIVVDNGDNVFAIHVDSLIKYDSFGNKIWVRNYSGTARAIALDLNGNVYVAGGSGNSYVTTKYDSGGNQLWSNTYQPTIFAGGNGANAVAVDDNSNVYVTGSTGYFEVPAWITVKYDSAGNQVWDRGFFSFSEGKSIALDEEEKVYVLGSHSTVKYDSSGNQLWSKDFAGEGAALALDTNGNVYVTGSTGSDFFTIKYSPLPQLKGDLNLDGVLDLNDVVFELNCVFMGISPPAAPAACNINCDGKATAADVVILLNLVFLSAAPPC